MKDFWVSKCIDEILFAKKHRKFDKEKWKHILDNVYCHMLLCNNLMDVIFTVKIF